MVTAIEELKAHAKQITKATPVVQCLFSVRRNLWVASISTLANIITATALTPEEACAKLIRNTKGMKLP